MALVDYNAGTHPGIKIDNAGGGAATFAATVKEALAKIASQPVGARLLAEISARNATVTFGGWGGIVKIYRAALDVKDGGSKAAPVSGHAFDRDQHVVDFPDVFRGNRADQYPAP